MATEFKLVPDPTFTAKVTIHQPGKAPAKVKFTFRRMERQQYLDWLAAMGDKSDLELVKEVATGWELVDPWDDAHIQQLLDHHIGSGTAVIETFMKENAQARLGNFLSSPNG